MAVNTIHAFATLIQPLTAAIAGRVLDDARARYLNTTFPPGSDGKALVLYRLPDGAIEFTPS